MEVSKEFKETIKAFLEKKAAEDETFATFYPQEGKSVEECCKYILNEVQAQGRSGYTDPEIYGMAMHYWEEKDIKVEEPGRCRVVVNHEVKLTEVQKMAIEQRVKDDYYKECMSKMKQKYARPSASAEKAKESEQEPTLF